MWRYKNRSEAGKQLAELLAQKVKGEEIVVLALPRGGVPIGYEVARRLFAPLDLVVVRKLGTPRNPEFAFGAIAEHGTSHIDEQTVLLSGISTEELAAITQDQKAELNRRLSKYCGDSERAALTGKTVIVVDDGIATGATLKAALKSVRAQDPKRIIAGVPVASAESPEEFRGLCDAFYCPFLTDRLVSVGKWYRDFSQVTDEEVIHLLREANDANQGSELQEK